MTGMFLLTRGSGARDPNGGRVAADLQKLVDFIGSMKDRQVADDFIATILRQNGWAERRIFQAFTAYYEGVLAKPVPSRGSRLESARDAFYYLLTFITLGFWTVALILFAEAYVDRSLPSPLDNSYVVSSFRSQVAGQLATLIIAFPLFLFVSRLVAQEVARRPESFESGVRKWLTYIALVITAVTLLSDAVWFLSSYLSGDLTTRFAWKALVLFLVAAGVFWYYLGTVRGDAASPSRDRVFGWAATAGVVVALVLGFTSIGTPARERAISLDEQRVQRLRSFDETIHTQWMSKHTLPASLREVSQMDAASALDPVTSQPFEYTPVNGSTYRLCASFDAASDQTTADRLWKHPAGHHCFVIDAATEGYPY